MTNNQGNGLELPTDPGGEIQDQFQRSRNVSSGPVQPTLPADPFARVKEATVATMTTEEFRVERKKQGYFVVSGVPMIGQSVVDRASGKSLGDVLQSRPAPDHDKNHFLITTRLGEALVYVQQN